MGDIGIRKFESNLRDGCVLSLIDNLKLQDPSELFDDDDMHDHMLFTDEKTGKHQNASSPSILAIHLIAKIKSYY